MATLTVSEKAKKKLLDSIVGEGNDPAETLVRVGARPGGCSGYTFTIETVDHKVQGDDEYDYGDCLFVNLLEVSLEVISYLDLLISF